MHARVTRFEGSVQQVDSGIKFVKEKIIPGAKKMTGFKAGYWLIDRASGKGLAIALFENEAAVKGSEGDAAQTRDQAGGETGIRITGVERYEVIAQA